MLYTKRNKTRCAADTSCDNAGAIVAAGMAESMPCDEWKMGSEVPLATAYFKTQDYREGYCTCEALCNGTLFPELVM